MEARGASRLPKAGKRPQPPTETCRGARPCGPTRLYKSQAAIKSAPMPLAPILLILAQASGPVATPLVLPTTQDYALVALPPASTGAATVRITRRTGSDQLDCTPSAIVGGTAIAVASCRLAMMKMGWMAAVKDRNGQDGTIPVVRLFWEPAPSTFQGDMGGATPIALDGKAPIASDPDKAATALQSDYTCLLYTSPSPRDS